MHTVVVVETKKEPIFTMVFPDNKLKLIASFSRETHLMDHDFGAPFYAQYHQRTRDTYFIVFEDQTTLTLDQSEIRIIQG